MDQERVALAEQGLPSSGTVGFSNLEKSGITTSEFVQQVEYQQALEGQLEQTIESIQGVQSAQVNLVVPQQSDFAIGNQPATTASILVDLTAGTTLTSGQVQAIVHLAASATPSLSPSDITVVDNHGDVLSSPGGTTSGTGTSDTQQTNSYDTQLSNSIESLLNRVVGVGNSAVQVHALLNFNQQSTTTKGLQTNAQGQPVTAPTGQTTSNSTYTGSGTPPSGVLGASQPATTTSGSGNYNTTSSQVTNAVGQVTQTVKQAPGQVVKTSVAVLLNSGARPKVSPAEVKSLVFAAAGLNTGAGDQLVVTSLPFAKPNTAQASALAAASASANKHQFLEHAARGRCADPVDHRHGVLCAADGAAAPELRRDPDTGARPRWRRPWWRSTTRRTPPASCRWCRARPRWPREPMRCSHSSMRTSSNVRRRSPASCGIGRPSEARNRCDDDNGRGGAGRGAGAEAAAGSAAMAKSVPAPVPRASTAKASLGLSNRQKVAVLLAQLGTAKAAPILKEMTDDEAISLTTEMVGLPPLSTEAVVEVVAEFLDRISRADLVSQGGLELAREFLQERLGQTRAQEVMDQIEGQQSSGPLSGLLRVDPQQALAVLGEQQPQVVAVLLAYLPPEDAASLLSELDPAFRVKVAKRIARLTRVDPAAIRQATALLEGKLRNSKAGGTTTLTGGTTAMAEILNHSDRSVEQQILSELEGDDQELAEQIRSKLFTFDDVVQLDDKSLQQIFRKMDVSTLALALKGPQLTPDVLTRIRSNLSERVITMIDEEMEVMGTVRNSQINGAQAMIVRTARQLDAEGIIVIARDGEVVV